MITASKHIRTERGKETMNRTVTRLSTDESRHFVEILNAPPRSPTKEMLAALKLYRETVISDVNPPATGML